MAIYLNKYGERVSKETVFDNTAKMWTSPADGINYIPSQASSIHGIHTRNLESETNMKTETKGLEVKSVRPYSTAALAGIKPGDRITKISVWPITDMASYRVAMGKMKPGWSPSFYWLTPSGTTIYKRITLEKSKARPKIGVTFGIDKVKKKSLAKKASELKRNISGATITHVREGSFAARIGIKKGDIVQKINDRVITSYGDYCSFINGVIFRGARLKLLRLSDDNVPTTLYRYVSGNLAKLGMFFCYIERTSKASTYKDNPKVEIKLKKDNNEKNYDYDPIQARGGIYVPGPIKFETNSKPEKSRFLKKAEAEMEAAMELMKDMKGVDAYMKARDLRESLRAENNKSLTLSHQKVQRSLNKLRQKREDEQVSFEVEVDKSGRLIHKGAGLLKRALYGTVKIGAAACLGYGAASLAYTAYTSLI